MAGDWIKVKTDLATDPAVIRTAATLGLEEDLVVGKLCRLWSWANTHTEDGHATGVTLEWLDGFLSCDNLGTALVSVGWLECHADGVTIPRFERHNGKSAKTRATARERKRRQRAADSGKSAPRSSGVRRNATPRNGHGPGVTQTGHTFDREEKRTEEKTTTPPYPPPVSAGQDETSHPCPAWSPVRGELVAMGVFDPEPALEAARLAGATPEDVVAILDHARTKPGAWGPGAIRNRVANHHPDLPPGIGWPEPSKDYERQRQAVFEEEKKRGRVERDRVEQERAELTRQMDQDREEVFGPRLDEMSQEDADTLASLLFGTGPVRYVYQTVGRTGLPRQLMLAELEKREATQ